MAVHGGESVRGGLRGCYWAISERSGAFHYKLLAVKSGWKDKKDWGRWRWHGWACPGTDYIWASGSFACLLTQSWGIDQSPGRFISWAVYLKGSDSWHCDAHCFSEGTALLGREQDSLHEVFVKGLCNVCSKSKYIQLVLGLAIKTPGPALSMAENWVLNLKYSSVVNKQLRIWALGTSLVFQRLRLQVPNAGGPGSIPGQGTRSHILQLKDPTCSKEDPACCN